jgi:hypothetical protein
MPEHKPFYPHARLRAIEPGSFVFEDQFWARRRAQLRQTILPAQFQKLLETGRLDNFYIAAGQKQGKFQGFYFNDSDVYKWLEAASWTTIFDPSPELSSQMDTAIHAIESAQQPDGYLDTYFMGSRAAERWANLADMHELYCAGHLFEAAVTHKQATGSERLMTVAHRLADLITTIFGPHGRSGVPGHPEVELGLMRLAEATGEVKYAQLAEFFVNQRGRGLIGGKEYHQDHLPLREMLRLTGHAVRAAYLCCGAADVYHHQGEAQLYQALERLWSQMTSRQMYVSGGIGSRHQGEAFGNDYELPNEQAYTETCAAIGSLLWSWRMLQTSGEAHYADILEWTLYNAVLPGISLDGSAYFYVNPLANDGAHRRQEWFQCACCPPNVARIIASLPIYFFSLDTDPAQPGVWLHNYAQGRLKVDMQPGEQVELRISSDYPYKGTVEIEIDAIQGSPEFSIHARIPGWCSSQPKVWLNGQETDLPAEPGSYLSLQRGWKRRDALRIEFPMPARWISSHPYALENQNRVALGRGPLLYCVEEADHPGVDVRNLAVSPNLPVTLQTEADFLGGTPQILLNADHEILAESWQANLYQPYAPLPPKYRPIAVRAIPYFAWGNRQPGRMQVWLKAR